MQSELLSAAVDSWIAPPNASNRAKEMTCSTREIKNPSDQVNAHMV